MSESDEPFKRSKEEMTRTMDSEEKAVFPYRRVHLMGIGGSGMSPLAHLLKEAGVTVTGCDRRLSPITDELVRQGIWVTNGHSPEHLRGHEALIVSSAIKPTEEERRKAVENGLPILHRSQALDLLMRPFRRVAVAGSHGKTTVTAILGYLLEQGGQDPSVMMGAASVNWGRSFRWGRGEWFVTEADESDRSLLFFEPDVAVITNVELDHPNGYKNIQDLIDCFSQFLAQVRDGGTVVVNGLCPNARSVTVTRPGDIRVVVVGRPGDDFWLESEGLNQRQWQARVVTPSGPLGLMRVGLCGRHNLINAALAIASARETGLPAKEALRLLSGFKGVKRRLELVAEIGGVRIVDDYAHHPTEIRASCHAVKETYAPQRLWVIFQPHRFSRTKFFFTEMAQSLLLADGLWVTDIYPADEEKQEEISGAAVADECRRMGASNVWFRTKEQWDAIVAEVMELCACGDTILILGAGDINAVVPKLIHGMSNRSD